MAAFPIHKTRDRKWQLLRVILSFPGVVGFFLPFAYGASPLEATKHWPGDWSLSSLGIVFGLAFLIFVGNLRLAISKRLSRPEIIGCVVFGIAGSILIATNLAYLVIDNGWPDWDEISGWSAIFIVWLLCAGHLVIVLRFRRRFFADSDAAVAALTAGYLPNAICCLVLFAGHWEIGAVSALLSCICYVGMIAATVRRLGPQRTLPDC